MTPSRQAEYDEDVRRSVRMTKQAIRARAKLVWFSALVTAPFVGLSGLGGWVAGLQPHEITGICCYNAMVTALFFFDTLRNTAHACFEEAQENGHVTCRDGIPLVSRKYRHHRLASLSFAIGGGSPWR